MDRDTVTDMCVDLTCCLDTLEQDTTCHTSHTPVPMVYYNYNTDLVYRYSVHIYVIQLAYSQTLTRFYRILLAIMIIFI